jgi:pseudomonalisin
MDMRRGCAALLTGALIASGLAASVAQAASSAEHGWVRTATAATPAPPHAVRLGALAGSRQLRIALVLRPRHAAELAYLTARATHRPLRPAEFRARFSPTAVAVGRTVRYLRSTGFGQVQVEGAGLLVTARGPARVVASAFHTRLTRVRVGHRSAFVNDEPAAVPARLASDVRAVVGLQTASRLVAASARTGPGCAAVHTAASQARSCFTPTSYRRFYDVRGAAAHRTRIAVFAWGDVSAVPADLRRSERAAGLPRVTPRIIRVGRATADTLRLYTWDMAAEEATGVAGRGVGLDIYAAPTSANLDLTRALARFVADDRAKAGVVGFGECEAAAALDGSLVADDELLEAAVAQGQTVFAAAGDDGGELCPSRTVTAGLDISTPGEVYPAASPYVVAVGGTVPLLARANRHVETVWPSSGGGVSITEAMPRWQRAVSPAFAACPVRLVPTAGCGRAVPDVALAAVGALTYVEGSRIVQNGTALSASIALGGWARVITHHGTRVGFAAPVLYAGYRTPAIRDVLVGTDGDLAAGPGFDLASGLGGLDIARIVGHDG